MLLFIDSLELGGGGYDASALAHAQMNGSMLLELAKAEPSRLAEIGVRVAVEQQVLKAALLRAEEGGGMNWATWRKTL